MGGLRGGSRVDCRLGDSGVNGTVWLSFFLNLQSAFMIAS